MKRRLELPMAFGLAAALLLVAGAERAGAIVYKASLLSVTGYNNPNPTGISGTSIIGLGTPVSGDGGSFLFDDSTHSVVELNPTGWAAQPNAVSGDSQVGHGSGPTTGGNTRAVLWHGTAASLVDLNPTGISNSYAYGVYGDDQVGAGFGTATGGPQHALLWHGTAASVVDLHPAEFAASQANGVFQDNIVGIGQTASGARAMLWQGAAHTVVNLHTAAYPQTYANDVSADSQVGDGVFSSLPGGERHALLWHGTAASVIDLQPTGFTQTIANGVAGAIQVGYGQGTITGSKQHALFWQGSAASVFDLHSLLTGLGHTFVSSGAADINANGVIVGYAADSSNVVYAVKWTPVVPGDYNGDAIVDAADYTVWRDTLGSTSDLRANGDDSGASGGKIDQADFAFWKANFGNHAGGAGGAAGVPEPATVTFAVIAIVTAGAFTRCRRHLGSSSLVTSRILIPAVFIAVCLGRAGSALAFTTIYPGPQIVPFVGGFVSPHISGVNDAGTVVGVAVKANDSRPYRWDGSGAAPVALGQTSATDVVGIDNTGTAVGFTNGSTSVYWPSSGTAPANLAIPASWSGSAPLAINDAGIIVGFGGGASGLSAVRWTSSGATATELGTVAAFGADASYYAYAVNAGGIAVGEVGYNPMLGGIGSRPIRWDAAGSATQLGDLGTYPTSNVFDNVSTARSINAAGTAVGQLLKNGGSALGYRAVRWDSGGTAATELGNLGTTASGSATDGAQAINDAGTIAGRAEKYNPAGTLLGSRAVRWNSGQTAAIELGNLGTDVNGKTTTDIGSARPMNAAGTIVGSAQKYDLAGNLIGNRAVYWGASNAAAELNSLIDPTGNWILTGASAISDTGWIAGNGLFDPDGAGGQAAYDRMFLLQLPQLAGDYNRNGIVDAADYTVWRETLGSTTDLRANGDNTGASAGKIDQADYALWKTNFGAHSGSGAGVTAAVPEPASTLMLCMGLVSIVAFMRFEPGHGNYRFPQRWLVLRFCRGIIGA